MREFYFCLRCCGMKSTPSTSKTMSRGKKSRNANLHSLQTYNVSYFSTELPISLGFRFFDQLCVSTVFQLISLAGKQLKRLVDDSFRYFTVKSSDQRQSPSLDVFSNFKSWVMSLRSQDFLQISLFHIKLSPAQLNCTLLPVKLALFFTNLLTKETRNFN